MRFTVSSSPEAPHLVRPRLANALAAGEPADVVLLATSELVSNAVLHGAMDDGAPMLVKMARGPRLRVDISHQGSAGSGPRVERTEPAPAAMAS